MSVSQPNGKAKKVSVLYIREIDSETIEWGHENFMRPFSAINSYRARFKNGKLIGRADFIGTKIAP